MKRLLLLISSAIIVSCEFECGVPAFTIATSQPGSYRRRIIGGWEATPHSFPWLVRVMGFVSSSSFEACGGSLIARERKNGTNLVLTAAHCLDYSGRYLPISSVKVIVGAHNVKSYDEATQREIPVRNYVHHEYTGTTKENDIALIQLKEVVPYTKYTRPVCLPKQGIALPTGASCIVSGWGTTYENGRSSPLLKSVDVIVLPQSECYLKPEKLSKMFCAGHLQGGKDSCQGDSGGPLVCEIDKKWVQFGIVSFGTGCGRRNQPGVYVNLPNYIDWVRSEGQKLEASVGSSGFETIQIPDVEIPTGGSGKTPNVVYAPTYGSYLVTPHVPPEEQFSDDFFLKPEHSSHFGSIFDSGFLQNWFSQSSNVMPANNFFTSMEVPEFHEWQSIKPVTTGRPLGGSAPSIPSRPTASSLFKPASKPTGISGFGSLHNDDFFTNIETTEWYKPGSSNKPSLLNRPLTSSGLSSTYSLFDTSDFDPFPEIQTGSSSPVHFASSRPSLSSRPAFSKDPLRPTSSLNSFFSHSFFR